MYKIRKEFIQFHTYLGFSGFFFLYNVFEALVEHGADVNAQDNAGDTVIHQIANHHEYHFSKIQCISYSLLIQKLSFPFLFFPLNEEKIVKFLIRNGADVNIKNKKGVTSRDLYGGNILKILSLFYLDKKNGIFLTLFIIDTVI